MPVISLSLRSSASHSNSSSSSWQQQQRGRDASSFVTRVSLSHSFISIYIQTRRESCRKSVYDSIIHSAKALFNPFYHQFHLASKLSGFQINETAAVICRYYAGQQQQFATNYFPSFFEPLVFCCCCCLAVCCAPDDSAQLSRIYPSSITQCHRTYCLSLIHDLKNEVV